MDDLSSEKTEMLLQFQDLTGIDSMGRCKELLESYNWNLEMAVQDQFNQNEGRAPVIQHSGQFQSPQDQVRELTRPIAVNIFHPNQRIYYASAIRRPVNWITWLKWLFAFPFRFTFSTVFDVFVFFYRFFVPDPRSRITDPYGDVRSFIEKFESSYGFMHPHFERMTFSQVMQKSKSEFRFLIVYLANFSSEDCTLFNTACLVNPDVYEFISNNALFWACSVESPEGYRVSKIFRSRYEPFVAVVCLRDNRLTVVGRIEGAQSGEAFLQRIRRIINDNTSYVRAARSEADDRNLSRLLRDQQDDAYQESLKRDREKAKQKEEENRMRKEQEDAILKQKQEKKMKKAETKLLKRTIRESFPAEPESGNPDALPLAFKMPSGERINRVFCTQDTLALLRNFVFCQECCPPKFDIMKSFPRKCLPNPEASSGSEMDQTLKEYGLSKNELLFVQQNFDSDDEESETGESVADSLPSLTNGKDPRADETLEQDSVEDDVDFVGSESSSDYEEEIEDFDHELIGDHESTT